MPHSGACIHMRRPRSSGCLRLVVTKAATGHAIGRLGCQPECRGQCPNGNSKCRAPSVVKSPGRAAAGTLGPGPWAGPGPCPGLGPGVTVRAHRDWQARPGPVAPLSVRVRISEPELDHRYGDGKPLAIRAWGPRPLNFLKGAANVPL
jgi:hypothetical protein